MSSQNKKAATVKTANSEKQQPLKLIKEITPTTDLADKTAKKVVAATKAVTKKSTGQRKNKAKKVVAATKTIAKKVNIKLQFARGKNIMQINAGNIYKI